MSHNNLNKLRDIFEELFNQIIELDCRFIEPHHGTASSLSVYEFDVKAFCVLAHAAMEEFIERTAAAVMEIVVYNYFTHGHVNDSMMMLMHTHGSSASLYDDKKNIYSTLKTYLTSKVKGSKGIVEKFTSKIDGNHGFSLKYMDSILTPLAIEPSDKIKHTASLEVLTSQRGAYAHKRHDDKSVAKVISPEQARVAVFDCLDICDDIRSKAEKKI